MIEKIVLAIIMFLFGLFLVLILGGLVLELLDSLGCITFVSWIEYSEKKSNHEWCEIPYGALLGLFFQKKKPQNRGIEIAINLPNKDRSYGPSSKEVYVYGRTYREHKKMVKYIRKWNESQERMEAQRRKIGNDISTDALEFIQRALQAEIEENQKRMREAARSVNQVCANIKNGGAK